MLSRRIRPTDVPGWQTLIQALGWGQTCEDLQFCLRCGPAIGSFDEAGSLLSTAALPAYSSGSELHGFSSDDGDLGFSWLAYVATRDSARKRGLASTQVDNLLNEVPQTRPIGLYGSVLGAPLYASRGFVDRGAAHLMCLSSEALAQMAKAPIGEHVSQAEIGGKLVPASECLQQVVELEACVYGTCDRSAALSRWVDSPRPAPDSPPLSWAVLDPQSQKALGCIVARPISTSGIMLGPLIGSTRPMVEGLLRQALVAAGERRVQVVELLAIHPWATDVPDGADESLALAERLGFEQVSVSRLMVRGGGADEPQGQRHGARRAPPWIDRTVRARKLGDASMPWPWAAAGFEYG